MAIQEGPIFREGVTIDGIIYYKWRGMELLPLSGDRFKNKV